MNSDSLICKRFPVLPVDIFEVSTPPKWVFLPLFALFQFDTRLLTSKHRKLFSS